MRGRALALCFLLALAGCGKQSSDRPPPNLNSPAATVKNQPVAPQKTVAEKPAKGTRLNQDGAETVEDANAGDSGAHNPLLAAVAATITGSSLAHAVDLKGQNQWQEGVNYTRLLPAQPTDAAAGQVEVLEFFWYACPHCYALEPQVEAWLKSKPANVTFKRVPVLWSPGHRSLARLYYTLEALGKINDMHPAVFKEIHANGDPLIGADPENYGEAERVQRAFVKKFNISETDFTQTYNSMSVNTALQHADTLVQRYRVSGVPTFVVNGKYIADVGSAGGPDKLLALVSDLAASEKH